VAPAAPEGLVRDLSRFTDAHMRSEMEWLRQQFPEVELVQASCPQPGCRAEVISTHPEALVAFSKAVGARFHVVESEIKGLGPEAGPERAGKIWVRFGMGNAPPATADPATPGAPAPAAPTTPAPPN
jgi:hypothetical protein